MLYRYVAHSKSKGHDISQIYISNKYLKSVEVFKNGQKIYTYKYSSSNGGPHALGSAVQFLQQSGAQPSERLPPLSIISSKDLNNPLPGFTDST